MRNALSATVLVALVAIPASETAVAQMQPPTTAGAKPKPVATTTVRPPGVQTPADTANAMAQAERLALQSDLAWVGEYNGAITGEVSERMVNAIKEYQKSRGAKQTGVLNPQERGDLAATARRRQDNVGWKIVTDPGTGVRLGIPSKLAPSSASDAAGTRWTSPTGTLQIVLSRRKEAGPSTAKLAEQEKKANGRAVDYTVVKPDFFVLSGLQGLKKFYLRGAFKGDEVRVMTILYDQAVENTVEPVVIAMSSAFAPFPTGPQVAGPPPRKGVEYGTGIVIAEDGSIVTDRQLVDGCVAITIAGHGNADRIAEDRERELALLRIYGARGLKPLNLAGSGGKAAVDLVGIADPQGQGGGNAVSTVKASVNGADLAPAPAPGFSGAVAMDADGKFAGLAQSKPVLVAGPANGAPQAVLVPPDAVRDFLKANAVTATGTSTDAKAAVVRVICVRK